MAGKSRTVVKHAASKALAPLGTGGNVKGEGDSGDGGRGAGDDEKQRSPLAAVWAIVQAYAIVALVCTIYNFIFGDAVQSKVPDEVQVRVAPLIVNPRSFVSVK